MHHRHRLPLLAMIILQGACAATARTYHVPAEFPAIQPALDAAAAGDTVAVAAGTYSGPQNSNLSFAGRDIVLLAPAGPDQTVLDGAHQSRLLKLVDGESAAAVLEGFSLINGTAPPGNPDGAAIYLANSSLTVRNCRIADNGTWSQQAHGGAVYTANAVAPRFEETVFINNLVPEPLSRGGAYYGLNSSPQFINCVFQGNGCGDEGGACYFFQSDFLLDGCVATDNSAVRSGGAIFANSSRPTLRNCRLEYNDSGAAGGGAYLWYTQGGAIVNCFIGHNSAANSGGGLYISQISPIQIYNSLLVHNSSSRGGGAGIGNSAVNLLHCVVANNQADAAGGLELSTEQPISLRNSIVWGNIGGNISPGAGDPPTVTYCDVEGGFEGTGNLDQPPRFVDPDFDRFTLAPDSPCIDAGNPAVADRCLPPGLGDARADLGAYGGPLNCVPAPCDLQLLLLDPPSQLLLGESIRFQAQLYNDCEERLDLDSLVVDFSWGPHWIVPGSAPVELMPGDTLSWNIDGSAGAPGTHQLRLSGYRGGAVVTERSSQLIIKPEAGPVRVPEQLARIQDAIDAAFPADTILIAAGTYGGEGNRDLNLHGRPLHILGVAGANATVIDCEEAGRGFLFHSGEGSDTVLEGLTILRGNAWNAPDGNDGGGICCLEAAPEMRDCVIQECSADYGGGIYCKGHDLRMSNCRLASNHAGRTGGALHAVLADLDLTECDVVDNRAAYNGGGLYLSNGRFTLTGTAVERNRADGGFSYGGGFYSGAVTTLVLDRCRIIDNRANSAAGGSCNSDTLICTDTEFRDNVAARQGGGVRLSYLDRARFDGCLFSANRAQRGGALYLLHSSTTVSNTTIADNHAESRGGGLYLLRGSTDLTPVEPGRWRGKSTTDRPRSRATEEVEIELRHCNIHHNSAGLEGGGLALFLTRGVTLAHCTLDFNTAPQHGGAILFGDQSAADVNNCLLLSNQAAGGAGVYLKGYRTQPHFRNCTFSANWGGPGGAIRLRLNAEFPPLLENCILWGDSAPEILIEKSNTAPSGTIQLRYCDVRGGWPGEGNIEQDPGFAEWRGRGYLLGVSSPCIDAGDPLWNDAVWDQAPGWPAGHPNGERSDMGAYGGPQNGGWLPGADRRHVDS